MTTTQPTQPPQQTKQSGAPWWLVLIQGIAAIIVGIMLLTSPGSTILIIVQILGIYWLISGIFGIVSLFVDRTAWGWKLFSGILGILAGIVIIQHPIWSAVLIPTTLVIILGLAGIVLGAVQLYMAFKGGGWGVGILGALSILFGLLLLFNPIVGAVALPFVLGGVGIVGGIIAVVTSFRMRK